MEEPAKIVLGRAGDDVLLHVFHLGVGGGSFSIKTNDDGSSPDYVFGAHWNESFWEFDANGGPLGLRLPRMQRRS